ncbi:unnamed protein product [Danaus chrysippus]|uniref:Elongation of very long chain fatty acids protein n=1 Tax=Danaus chrysippus TaxID=151541 RepID=A0A8J2QDN1_9NEOP|nr:unnamed protein product [Danaus chrysippus]
MLRGRRHSRVQRIPNKQRPTIVSDIAVHSYSVVISLDRLGAHQLTHPDPRTNPWLLMSSPFPTLLICLSYVYLVKVLGPRFMENRKPYELKNVLIAYNFLQVVFSSWLFYESMMGGWLGHYSFRCQPVDRSNNPIAIRVQFVGIMVHAFQLLFIECDYPRAFVWWIGMHAVMFFFLFKDFYNQSYSKPKARAKSPVPVQTKIEEVMDITYKNGVKNGYANGHTNGLVRARTVLPAGN